MKSVEGRIRSGFTLFEVLIAMAVFVLMAGGIYLAVSTSVSASVELGTFQMDARKHASFVQFLRDGFHNLPPEAEIQLRSRDLGQLGSSVELILKNAPGAFETGALEALGGGVALATIPDGKGKSRFSILRFSSKLSDADRDRFFGTARWLPVLDDVETLKWRFWDKEAKAFIETWDQASERPELVELTFSTSSQPESTNVFRLHNVKRSRSPAPPAPAIKK